MRQVLIALGLIIISTQGLAAGPNQTAYRCGNAYSQAPCPGGQSIDTTDARIKDQKTQANAANQRNKRLTDAMEKSRQQREAAQRKAALKEIDKSAAGSVNKTTTDKKPAKPTAAQKKKNKEPVHFTAKSPGDKKRAAADKQASNAHATGSATSR